MKGSSFSLLRLCLLAAAVGLLSCSPAPRPRTKPLEHSAYVWRQGWTPQAVEGLSAVRLPSRLAALNILVGECGLSGGRRAVHPPWGTLGSLGRTLSLSVRIGTRGALRDKDRVDLSEGFSLLMSGLAEARQAEVPVASLQIDFDCPERLLTAYAGELRTFRKNHTELPLTITALPAWLDAKGFDELIASTDGWTLQLHGTNRPKLGQTNQLFSAKVAQDWINMAKSYGRPFRVALPTYAYVACFGQRGEYLGMHAEQSSFPMGTRRTLPLPAEPREVTRLLRLIDDAKYEQVVGVDWFRLPLPGDRQNWTMHGFGEILAGRDLPDRLELVTVQHDGLYDFSVRNPSDQPLALPSVRIGWSQGHVIGVDATSTWRTDVSRRTITFASRDFVELIGPGETRVVGWLRLSEAQTLSTEIPR
jgi:hypothetical protein